MFSDLIQQVTNCVTEMTCLPDWTNPLDALRLYQEFYGIPNAVTLGIFLGIIEGAIYVATRSLAVIGVLGIYTMALVGSTFLADGYVAAQYRTIVMIVIMSIATVAVIFFLKLTREA